MKMKSFLTVFGVLSVFLCLILFPTQASAAVKEGLALCSQTIIPAMFPYFVLSDLFISLGCAETLAQRFRPLMERLFHVSGKGATPLLLGLTGGYPMGAKAVAELYANGQISKDDANRLLFFTCNAGPAFLIGVIGGAQFHSVAAGLTLYGIHVISALLCGLLISANPTSATGHSNPVSPSAALSFPNALVHAVTSATRTTLQVCGYIILFCLVIAAEKLLFPNFCVVLQGITELSSGCEALAQAGMSWPLKFSLISATASFGGLCVLCQTMSVLSGTGLSIRTYVFGKFTQAAVSAAISYPVSFLLKRIVSAAAFPENVQFFSPWSWKILPILLLILFFLQFPSRFSRRHEL